jgi:hypothetical protein
LKVFRKTPIGDLIAAEVVKFCKWPQLVSNLLPPSAVLKIEVAGNSSTSMATYVCKQ